jgi:large subunit ribosomal protein L22
MGRFGYSLDVNERTARAIGGELRISPKWSVEICRELKGKKLEKAVQFLEEIKSMKRPLHLRRYKKGVAHKRMMKGYAGRFPVKAAQEILKVLHSAKANAEYQGLDPEKLYVMHICAKRGRIIKKMFPRAFGRASPHNETTTNIEVILKER